MDPFAVLFACFVAAVIVRLVVRYYREEEVHARYSARARLASGSPTGEDSPEPNSGESG